MEFFEHQIETPEGHSLVLVTTPDTTINVGRDRLEELREAAVPGWIDQKICEGVLGHKGRVRAVILRGRDQTGTSRWKFDKALNESEVAELGYLLVKSQVITYRRLVESGVQVHFITELDDKEIKSMNDGKSRLLEELREEFEEKNEHTALIAFQMWLLENFMYFPYITAEQALDDLLPEILPIAEGGRHVVEQMLAVLPPDRRRGQ
ncbi:MAG: hypothetical protein GY847_21005 [Proteobacteria bacterium]|nr:hypothetical protein [Pseudomonadota bacterium]